VVLHAGLIEQVEEDERDGCVRRADQAEAEELVVFVEEGFEFC